MARVYLAEDEKLGRKVAVKRLHSDSPDDAAGRFEREARLGASLNHPNLVSVYDIETEPESVLIVMEYVEGQTLRELMADGPLGIEQAISVVRDIGAALDHAHAQGVVHRDVKPANILIRRDGVAKLADLGIAKAAESTQLTSTGMVVGTASYMAPEQLDGSSAGPATDVYALRRRDVRGARRREGPRRLHPGGDRPPGGHQPRARPAQRMGERACRAPRRCSSAAWRATPRTGPESAGQLARELEEGLRGGATAATAALPADRTAPPRCPHRRSRPHPAAAGARHPRPARAGSRLPLRAAAGARLPAWLPVAALLAAAGRGGRSPCSLGWRRRPGERALGRLRRRPGRRTDRADLSRPRSSRPSPAHRGGAAGAPRSSRPTAAGAPILRGAPQLDAAGLRADPAGQLRGAVPIARRAVASFPSRTTPPPTTPSRCSTSARRSTARAIRTRRSRCSRSA